MEDRSQFQVDCEHVDATVSVVTLEGEVDIYSSPAFKEALLGCIDHGVERVVIDFSAVTFVDSTALGVLVSGAKRINPRGGGIDIVCTNENIVRILEITGLDRVFTLYATRREAFQPTIT